jgi:hypothetical protein
MTIIKMIQNSTTGKVGGKKRTVKRRTHRWEIRWFHYIPLFLKIDLKITVYYNNQT